MQTSQALEALQENGLTSCDDIFIEITHLRPSHSTNTLGTFSNADFCDGDGDRKSSLFPVDVLHFGGKPSSLRADVRTEFPVVHKMWVNFLLSYFKYLPFLSHLVSEGFKTNWAIYSWNLTWVFGLILFKYSS